IDSATAWANNQAKSITTKIYAEAADIKEQVEKEQALKGNKFIPLENREIIALIAYLQRLGTDIKTTDVQTASNN
ncbi:hypothetical protein GNY06_12865, partial [Elizabethkingia argentiflava]